MGTKHSTATLLRVSSSNMEALPAHERVLVERLDDREDVYEACKEMHGEERPKALQMIQQIGLGTF